MRKLQFKQRYQQHFLTITDLQQMGNLTKVLNADKIINILNFISEHKQNKIDSTYYTPNPINLTIFQH